MSTHLPFDWKSLPPPSGQRIAMRIQPAAERAVRNGHPWLFAQAIRRQSHEGQAGDLAVIFDRKDRFLAVGLFDPTSPIRVRILQHGKPLSIDQSWFQARIQAASALRRMLQQSQTTGYRLIHGENDGMPGLVIDRYEHTYVLKLYTAAWIPYLSQVADGLIAVVDARQIVLRLSRDLARQPASNHGLADGDLLQGSPVTTPLRFQENGIQFEVDVVRGQKTGFFLDQRDNRARVEKLAAGKTVLNVFAYTGGFSLYAARGGSPMVTSLDISQPALDAANRNFLLNQDHARVAACKHRCIAGDAFNILPQLARNRSSYDLIVVDPPSFAKQKSEQAKALTAYARLTRLALPILSPDGIIVMASCSSRVEATSFFEIVQRESAALGRPLSLIEQTFHALDHPISFREGAYLKCLFATVP